MAVLRLSACAILGGGGGGNNARRRAAPSRTPPSRHHHLRRSLRRATQLLTLSLLSVLLLLLLLSSSSTAPVAAYALNTCEAITRCSECVYDQTQGIMPPSLLCGWCASTQTCKQVNSSILAYYGVHTSATADGKFATDDTVYTPAEMAAFQAAFCPDLRERDVNGMCPDMTCAAARTTNNIYICRAPPLVALVFGCILFVITLVVYMWMRTIRQLPWKYEPFLSDMLEGRAVRRYDEALYDDHDGFAADAESPRDGNANWTDSGKSGTLALGLQRTKSGAFHATRPGSPLRNASQSTLTQQPPQQTTTTAKNNTNAAIERKNEEASDNDSDDGSTTPSNDAPSAETASTVSNPSYLDAVSHNVVVSHHPRAATAPDAHPTTAAAGGTGSGEKDHHDYTAYAATGLAGAATGYCPICKCRQPAYLGPGEVCFWCNVARFTFMPFFIALISSVAVILLDFAVSLKPWFSDWYFAEVLIIAYASYGGLLCYMMRHHNRVPLFFFESEAERKANQRIWTATHNRPASSLFSPSVPASQNTSTVHPARHHHHGTSTPVSPADGGERGRNTVSPRSHHAASHVGATAGGASAVGRVDHRRHHDHMKLHMLNDARRNMASTYYLQLALQLRGRSLLSVFPELKQYEAQLEGLQATPATLTAVGDVVAVMRTTNTAGSTPGSPLKATHNNTTNNMNNNNNNNSSLHPGAANVPVISPFAAAASAMDVDTTAAAVAAAAAPGGPPIIVTSALTPGLLPTSASGVVGSPHSLSSPSQSSGYFSGPSLTDTGRLPPLAQVAATPPQPQLQQQQQPVSQNTTPAPEGLRGPRPGDGVANHTFAYSSQPPLGPATAAGTANTPSTSPPPQQQQQQQAAPPAPPAGGPIGSAAAANVPEALARQKRGETVQLLSSDFLSPQYCRALKSTLYRDEYITWCAKPNMRGVLMENEWLLLVLATGFLFGVWMVMLASVTDDSYAIVELSGSTAVSACGLLVMVFFALVLVIVVRQCGRLYVLTNERLITVYESVITPITTATDLSTVRFAALYGYRGLLSKQPCLTFSWEVPATERKMPVIKSHKFPGIMHLQEFLFFFRLVAPQTPFHLEQITESTRQDRQEWRLHIFLAVGAFVILPIITIYPQAMPDVLGVYLYVLGLLLILATLLRGFRAQQMTYAPLNIAASWAPEGEVNVLDAVEAATAALPAPPSTGAALTPLPLPPASARNATTTTTTTSPRPAPGTEFSSVQPAIPSAGTSPTVQHTRPFPVKESTGRAVQVATPTSNAAAAATTSPTGKFGVEFRRLSPTSNTATSPRFPDERVGIHETVSSTKSQERSKGAAAAAAAGTNDINITVTPVSATASPKSARTPSVVVTPAAMAALTSAAHAAGAPATIVPVNAAIREMEESITGLIGVGVTGGSSGSANNSFSNGASVYVAGSASQHHSHPSAGTGRTSPYHRRPSSLDVAGSAYAHAGVVSIGPGGAAQSAKPSTASTNAAAAGASTATETANSTACNSPTNPGTANLTVNHSLCSNPHTPGTPREHDDGTQDAYHPHSHHQQQQPAPHASRSRSDSEEALSGRSGSSPGTSAMAHGTVGSSTGSTSGGGGGHTGRHHGPAAATHVVPASLRSTKQDGHTTWGDQVEESD